jgi:zinc finger protein-like protein
MLVRTLRVVTRTLRDEMVDHLRMEEEQLWPILTSNFSKDEQAEIVARIFGLMPADRFRELLPWMIRVLSTSEQATMMTHILQVTKSTMFETWLNSWFRLPGASQSGGGDAGGCVAGEVATGGALSRSAAGNASAAAKAAAAASAAASAKQEIDETASAAAALVLLRRRDNVKLAIREIAADSSLAPEVRSRMMQQVMLAPWSQKNAAAKVAAPPECSDANDRAPSYRDKARGVLGCSHYARACKLVAACCEKVHTCRLCHDATESHMMDRTATREMICMHCSTKQPVAKACREDGCGKTMARYFCEFCRFFDDDPSRNIYHCPSCNVCRVGKGLGQDRFHCMKCNTCMAMKFANKHVCVERAMESDCPVCHQYLFVSTTPVSYLQCGHLMHSACKSEYTKNGNYSCPVCMKSLGELAPVFKKLDHLLAGESMPREYRTARCDVYCMDCNRAATQQPYHFLYNKCPGCASYNTRVDHVDANAGVEN